MNGPDSVGGVNGEEGVRRKGCRKQPHWKWQHSSVKSRLSPWRPANSCISEGTTGLPAGFSEWLIRMLPTGWVTGSEGLRGPGQTHASARASSGTMALTVFPWGCQNATVAKVHITYKRIRRCIGDNVHTPRVSYTNRYHRI